MGRPPTQGNLRRWFGVGGGLLVLCIASIAACRQDTRAEPADDLSFGDVLFRPLEVNRQARLPVIDGSPACLEVSADGQKVWLGSSTSILYSANAGATWNVQPLKLPEESEWDVIFNPVPPAPPGPVVAPDYPPAAIPAKPAPTPMPAGEPASTPAGTPPTKPGPIDNGDPNGPDAPKLKTDSLRGPPPAASIAATIIPEVDLSLTIDPSCGDSPQDEYAEANHLSSVLAQVPTRAQPFDPRQQSLPPSPKPTAATIPTPSVTAASTGTASSTTSTATASGTTSNRPPTLPLSTSMVEVVRMRIGATDAGHCVVVVGVRRENVRSRGSFSYAVLIYALNGDHWERVAFHLPVQTEQDEFVLYDTADSVYLFADFSTLQIHRVDDRWVVELADDESLPFQHLRAIGTTVASTNENVLARLANDNSGILIFPTSGMLLNLSKPGTWQSTLDLLQSQTKGASEPPSTSSFPGQEVFFLSSTVGWSWPQLQQTENGGETWSPPRDDWPKQVTDVVFAKADDKLGWLTAADGVYRTTDGGETWHRRSMTKAEAGGLGGYMRFPPVWFYVVFVCGVGLVVWGVQQQDVESKTDALALSEGKRRVSPTVANQLVDDRPVENVQEDRLNFRDVAIGLAQFLRNPKTKPPLTVAVTGKWGSGKTSIMKMTESELKREGYPTVWFNAWHHREEVSLLAALLVQVRRKVSLSWLTMEGFNFRLRLAWKRFMSPRFPRVRLALGVIVTSFAVGHLVVNPEPFVQVVETAGLYLATAVDVVSGAKPDQPEGEASLGDLGWTLLLGGGGISVVRNARSLGRMLSVLQIEPTKLLAQLNETPKPADLTEQLGFRTQFATEFREALESLESALGQRLVIFIDDLDRCQPGHVIEVLETVNYLVSSAPCIVVFGIAEDEVRHYVGLHFRDVAESMATVEQGRGVRRRRAGVMGQLDFAERYLEKLVNVEIRVPQAEPARLYAMAAGAEPVAKAKVNSDSFRVVQFIYRAKPYMAFFSTAALIVLAFWIGRLIAGPAPSQVALSGTTVYDQPAGKPLTSTSTGTSPIPTATSRTTPTSTATGEIVAARPTPSATATPALRPVIQSAGETGGGPIWPYAMFCFAAVVALVSLRPERGPRTKPINDSQRFTKALETWLPLIQASNESPRAVKRFSNRVRLYALRERPVEEVSPDRVVVTRDPRSWWNWWKSAWWNAAGRKQFELQDCPHQEDLLVAVAAIEELCPSLYNDPTDWALLSDPIGNRDRLLSLLADEDEPPEDPTERAAYDALNARRHDALCHVVSNHQAVDDFTWPPPASYRELVLRLSTDFDA